VRGVFLLLVSSALLAEVAAQESVRTGTLETPRDVRWQGLLGGTGPRFVLYLRADGRLGEHGRAAIGAALGALARLPGASIELDVEPLDRDGPALADALADLPSESTRRALLAALLDQDLPRWADPATLSHLGRQLGLPVRSARTSHPQLSASGTGRALLRRPVGMSGAVKSFFDLLPLTSAAPLGTEDVDALVAREAWPVAPRDPLPARAIADALGDPLATHLVVIRAALPLGTAARIAVRVMRAPLAEGRAQVRIEFDEDVAAFATPPEALLDLVLREGTQAERFGLLTALVEAESDPTTGPHTEERAIAMLRAAGIDPAPWLAARRPPTATRPPASVAESRRLVVTVDGTPISAQGIGAAELERRLRRPSLRQRLEKH
jgi:hypothetical protein